MHISVVDLASHLQMTRWGAHKFATRLSLPIVQQGSKGHGLATIYDVSGKLEESIQLKTECYPDHKVFYYIANIAHLLDKDARTVKKLLAQHNLISQPGSYPIVFLTDLMQLLRITRGEI